jgi:hypothetical protein
LIVAELFTAEEIAEFTLAGGTIMDVVRWRWPDANDEQAHYVLWEMTPFPIVSGALDLIEALAIISDTEFEVELDAEVAKPPILPSGRGRRSSAGPMPA